MEAHSIDHRQRIERCLAGITQEKTPIALWRHFPVDDQTPDGLANAIVAFQVTYDFDLVKVTPSSSFCLKDWGADDVWKGHSDGTRDYIHRVIKSPDDWLKLTILDPYQGGLGEQLNCLEMVCNALGDRVPVLQTVFSPLAQAKNLIGGQNLLVHLRQFPEAVFEGLNIIAESTLRFIDAIHQTKAAGIFYAVQHGSYLLLSPSEYQKFGRVHDIKLLEASSDMWLNMLHLHGEHIFFENFIDYPIQVINWHDQETLPSLADAKKIFKGVVCGGLQRINTMELGTPEQVRAEARDAILATGNQRFILGTGCVLPITTPRINIITAVQSSTS